MKALKLISVLLVVFIQLAGAQTGTMFSRTDSLISLIEKSDRGMGSVSVFLNGEEVYKRHYGFSSLENKVAVNDNTLFRIGSISKIFTAALVFKQIELGRLKLSDPLSKWFPTIGNSRKITIKHLLSHQSGIYNFTNDASYLQWNTQPHSRKNLLERILRYPNVFMPGEKTEYSNSNFVLLTWILEDVSGEKYTDLLEKWVLKPTGLKQTFFTTDSAMPLAASYTYTTSWVKSAETHESIPLGAGSIVSTTTELNRFLVALLSGKLLHSESLEAMKSISADRFGLGLIRVPFHNYTGYGHTGGIDGFQSQLFGFRNDSVTVAITSNAVIYPVNELMIGVLSDVFQLPFRLPVFKTAIETTPEQLQSYAGVYSTPGLPVKITVSLKEGILTAQGTGQPSFPLTCTGPHQFAFEQAGIVLEFQPAQKQMVLVQMGNRFVMKKE
jgi:CubicO group peptidase (beta-lactamase class C family)